LSVTRKMSPPLQRFLWLDASNSVCSFHSSIKVSSAFPPSMSVSPRNLNLFYLLNLFVYLVSTVVRQTCLHLSFNAYFNYRIFLTGLFCNEFNISCRRI
jgi:hypothetical protein